MVSFRECWSELIKLVPEKRGRQSNNGNTETWSERCPETEEKPPEMFPPVLEIRPDREAERGDPDPQNVSRNLTGTWVNQKSPLLYFWLDILYHFEISWISPFTIITSWVNITGRNVTLTESLTWYRFQQVEGMGSLAHVAQIQSALLGRCLTLILQAIVKLKEEKEEKPGLIR